MKRTALIVIVSCGVGEQGRMLRQSIYEHVKQDIPKAFRSRVRIPDYGQVALPLEENSPSFNYVMDVAEAHHLHPSVFQIVHYTPSELERVPFFRMMLPSPLELEGKNAADYGTKYAGACPLCGFGGTPIGDVFVDRKFMRTCKIGVLPPDICVSEGVKELIESNQLTGISFDHKIRDFKGRDMPDFYVMDVHHILPPMSNSVWLKQFSPNPRYKQCGHQVLYLRSDIQYEKYKLEGANDFNLTCEYINNYRVRELIVSAKVRKVFRANRIRAFYEPVAML